MTRLGWMVMAGFFSLFVVSLALWGAPWWGLVAPAGFAIVALHNANLTGAP